MSCNSKQNISFNPARRAILRPYQILSNIWLSYRKTLQTSLKLLTYNILKFPILVFRSALVPLFTFAYQWVKCGAPLWTVKRVGQDKSAEERLFKNELMLMPPRDVRISPLVRANRSSVMPSTKPNAMFGCYAKRLRLKGRANS